MKSVTIIVVISVFLLLTVIVGASLYLVWKRFEPQVKNNQLSNAYFKKLHVEVYTLLPGYQIGKYEGRVVIGGITYPPLNERGIIWDKHTMTTTPHFDISVTEGMGVEYTIYDVGSDKSILTTLYSITSDDMKNADILYLCDGVVVGNQNFMYNFKYRFSGKWDHGNCNTKYAILSWNTDPLYTEFYSTDGVLCSSLPKTLTIPFTHSLSGLTPERVGWKGAWIGMEWYVNLGSDKGIGIGSIKLTDPTKQVLVISPGKLEMSTT